MIQVPPSHPAPSLHPAIQIKSSQVKMWAPEASSARGIQEVPLRVLINPVLSVLDPGEVLVHSALCTLVQCHNVLL
jgi:hypothetical protein